MFTAIMDFLYMHGYGCYVWTSYASVLAFLGWQLYRSIKST